jgi:hypothetical protein
MVLMPNVLKVRVAPIDGSTVHARVVASTGDSAISNLTVSLHQ